MTAFTAIADDLTGACDVAAELAVAGLRVRVAVDPRGMTARDDDGIVIVNTQSRALDARVAYARVRDTLGMRRAPVVLKKIDTALRGHLGAELDGALDALDAPAFVLAARAQGLLLIRGGERAVRFLPPLTVTEAEIEDALARADRALTALEQEKS